MNEIEKAELKNIFYKIWFPEDTKEITIVAGLEDIGSKKKDYKNYHKMDTLTDRDAIYHIGILLTKKYKNVKIHLENSLDALNSNNFEKNFVIIGGPGGDSYLCPETNKVKKDYGNHVCRKFSKIEPSSKILYSDDCESLIFEGNTYEAAYEKKIEKGGKIKLEMVSDFGYFSAFSNFYDPSNCRVVVIHGIHTLGVLGATKVFDDDEDNITLSNYSILKEKLKTDDYSFETFFQVSVDRFKVLNPRVEANRIIPKLSENDKTESQFKQVFLSHSSENKEEAKIIKNEIEKNGISVYMAPHSMKADDWNPQLKAQIEHKNLKVFLLLFTKQSQESKPVRDEIDWATDANKVILPYQTEDFEIKKSTEKFVDTKHIIKAFGGVYDDPLKHLIDLIKNEL